MPFTYLIDAERGLATITTTGAATGETFIEALLAVTRDPAWRPTFDRLWNGHGITRLDMTPDQLDRLIALERAGATCARRTAIVVLRPVDVPAAKAHKALMRGTFPTEIFLTVEEALDWLGGPVAEPGAQEEAG